jgi:hypothetical protein
MGEQLQASRRYGGRPDRARPPDEELKPDMCVQQVRVLSTASAHEIDLSHAVGKCSPHDLGVKQLAGGAKLDPRIACVLESCSSSAAVDPQRGADRLAVDLEEKDPRGHLAEKLSVDACTPLSPNLVVEDCCDPASSRCSPELT